MNPARAFRFHRDESGGRTSVPPVASVQKIPANELSKAKDESNKKLFGASQ